MQADEPLTARDADFKAIAEKLSEVAAGLDAIRKTTGFEPPPSRVLDLTQFFERTLSMIADTNPKCRCRYCPACLARDTLAGPEPGAAWFEWERLKEINRERLKDRFPKDSTWRDT